MDHAMRYLFYAFPLKMKQIACINTVYTLYAAACVNIPSICSFFREGQYNALPLLFSKMDSAVMSTLNIGKHFPPHLQVSNISNVGSSRIGHLILINETVQNSSLMFGSVVLKNAAPGFRVREQWPQQHGVMNVS